MSDPTLVPWNVGLLGLAVAVPGVVLALWGNSQHRPTKRARVGRMLVWVGGTIALTPPTVLALQMFYYCGAEIVKVVVQVLAEVLQQEGTAHR